jgi:DNA-binding ferritin-like protein (Dps family)
MKLDKIKALLESAKLTEEQVQAFDAFLESYAKSIEEKFSKKKAFNESNEEMIPKSIVEKMFNEVKRDAELAFNLYKEDAKIAFNEMKRNSEKAFELYAEDLQNESTDNMIHGLQELFTDVEDRVKRNFNESKEASILNQIKTLMTPLIASESNKELLEEIDRLKSMQQIILEENEVITKERTINTLIKDFPEEYYETVKEFISGAKDEDEIYERFGTICEMIENGVIAGKKVINEEVKEVKKQEVVKTPKMESKEDKRVKPINVITEELNKGIVQSVKSKSVDKKVVNEDLGFSQEEKELLDMFLNG